jgi:hypothetical protein
MVASMLRIRLVVPATRAADPYAAVAIWDEYSHPAVIAGDLDWHAGVVLHKLLDQVGKLLIRRLRRH